MARKILVVAGQSNAVGYDESPVSSTIDAIHPRVNQLGFLGQDNLKIVPLTHCAQNYQDMTPYTNPANPTLLGTKGIHLPLGKLLADKFKGDEIVILPCAYGGTGFNSGATGTYDSSTMKPSSGALKLKWSSTSPYYLAMRDRLEKLLKEDSTAEVIGVVWIQGENDSSDANSQKIGFENMTKTFFDYFNAKGYGNRVISGSFDRNMWFNIETTYYWYGVGQCQTIWDNYNKWNPLTYVRVPRNTDTNLVNGTGATTSTRQAHFGNDTYRTVIAPLVFNALTSRYVEEDKEETGYDKFSFARATYNDIVANIYKLNNFEPVIATDKNILCYRNGGVLKTLGADIDLSGYVKKSGDTMTGDLAVPKVTFSNMESKNDGNYKEIRMWRNNYAFAIAPNDGGGLNVAVTNEGGSSFTNIFRVGKDKGELLISNPSSSEPTALIPIHQSFANKDLVGKSMVISDGTNYTDIQVKRGNDIGHYSAGSDGVIIGASKVDGRITNALVVKHTAGDVAVRDTVNWVDYDVLTTKNCPSEKTSTSGHYEINGTVVQYGAITLQASQAGVAVDVTYPIEFKNRTVSVTIGNSADGSTTNSNVVIGTLTKTGFKLIKTNFTSQTTVYWNAIGH